MPEVKMRWWYAVGAVAAIALLCLYGMVDPASHFFPRCIFKSLTGLDCPGCGSQRAIHSLLTGNLSAAWHYNAMLVASIPAVGLMMVAGAMKNRVPRLYNALNSQAAILFWAVALMLWWILRNLL